jgi:acyl transferase domain-containing protein/aryl carrier-like protein
VRNTKAALKANGIALINEISGNHLFAHLTFGLLEGWWLYEDAALRIPGCPGLAPASWQALLESEGWRSVFYPAEHAHALGQQIVVAESDGMIRQAAPHVSVPPAIAPQSPVQAPAAAPVQGMPGDGLRERSRKALARLVGEAIRLPSHQVDTSATLDKYGIDSILVVQLTNALQGIFSDVHSTVFFEHQTIDALVEHFMLTQRDALIRWVGADAAPAPAAAESTALPKLVLPRAGGWSRRFAAPVSPVAAAIAQPAVQDVAIIGISGRFPRAKNLGEFWANLSGGVNCTGEVPASRWDHSLYFDPDRSRPGTSYSKWGGFVDGVDEFDPLFFNISPREAEMMDPQERLFLQEVYAGMEDAGHTPSTLSQSGKVGVFVGVMNGYYPSGARYWSIANRVSYLFNFQGPSLSVDTACSSSLTAIHLALESLRNNTCDCAIAGGVNLILDPIQLISLSSVGMLSSDDKCKSFGANADGFVDGEAVGAIVLKPLHKAIADGDRIHGVIKGSMVNAGGKTNGYTVPNPAAQAEVVSEAMRRAQVHPRTVSYIEAHGTGTSLGDPVEIAGLSRAFAESTPERQFCAIGSAKSNIGHCESAAGIAGVSKVLLQMRHGKLAPSLHAQELNPNIPFAATPFVVQRELADWERPVVEIGGQRREYPRIAGVSSFGAGGANAHVLIQEYVATAPAVARPAINAQCPGLFVLSARDDERLRDKAAHLLDWLRQHAPAPEDLADAAFTLQVGREAMEERLAIIATSLDDLCRKLDAFAHEGRVEEDVYQGQAKRNRAPLGWFASDDDMANVMDTWIAKGKYAKLLDLWVNGMPIDWRRLYGTVTPSRIGLPSYPFARERYWISRPAASTAPAAPGASRPQTRASEMATAEGAATAALPPDDAEFYRLIEQVAEGQLSVEAAAEEMGL